MAFNDSEMEDLRDVMSAAKPAYDKLNNGDTSLTPTEAGSLTRAYDTWQNYVTE